jgi:hypothetical protein
MGKQAVEFAQAYGWNQIARRMVALYQEVMGEERRT